MRSRTPRSSFNSRPREGGDITDGQGLVAPGPVSTHAPARGATGGGVAAVVQPLEVSTHAPARGATPPGGQGLRDGHSFNSRPREGGDGITGNTADLLVIVSTHAPARGATVVPLPGGPSAVGFNSRPREGGDETPHDILGRMESFNSRPREGGDSRS